MRINLSKKKKIIVISILTVVLAGSGGYLLWRVNQQNSLGSKNSNASKCSAVCDGKTYLHGDVCNGNENYAGYDDGNAANGADCCSYSLVCTHSCGDGTCDSDETVAGCPKDCAKCGDGVCSSTESLTSCPADCSVCGDGKCTGSETLTSCAKDCSVCGDNKCTGSESADTCASDCACKAFTWTNEPSGGYKTTAAIPSASITNPNSTSATTSGITIKLNDTTLNSCSSTTTGSCYDVSTNTSGKQVIGITFFKGVTTLEEGTYTLSVSLPGILDSCAASTTFTISKDAVPQTGIFDGVMGKLYLGSSFVFLGILTTQLPKFNYVLNILGERNKEAIEIKRRKREEGRRFRFENRFK